MLSSTGCVQSTINFLVSFFDFLSPLPRMCCFLFCGFPPGGTAFVWNPQHNQLCFDQTNIDAIFYAGAHCTKFQVNQKYNQHTRLNRNIIQYKKIHSKEITSKILIKEKLTEIFNKTDTQVTNLKIFRSLNVGCSVV